MPEKNPILILFILLVAEIEKEIKLPSGGDVRVLEDIPQKPLISGSIKLKERPIVIGSGPAGLFASLILAQKRLQTSFA